MDLVSVITGGGAGLLGGIVTGVANYFQKRQSHAHEIELKKLAMEERRLEAESAAKVAAIQLEGAVEAAASKERMGSYREAANRFTEGVEVTPAQAWLLVIVDFVRQMMRPLLTMIVVVTALRQVDKFADSHPEFAEDLASGNMALASMAFGWWFGQRAVEKFAPRRSPVRP